MNERLGAIGIGVFFFESRNINRPERSDRCWHPRAVCCLTSNRCRCRAEDRFTDRCRSRVGDAENRHDSAIGRSGAGFGATTRRELWLWFCDDCRALGQWHQSCAECRLSLRESSATFAERKATISDQPTQLSKESRHSFFPGFLIRLPNHRPEPDWNRNPDTLRSETAV